MGATASAPQRAECSALQELTVFSHRGAAGPAEPNVIVTAQSVQSLVERGVRAFDMDLFFTTDGSLLVGHPVAMGSMLQLKNDQTVFDMSEAELNALTAPAAMPPDSAILYFDPSPRTASARPQV